jgi:hypothetical protein
VFEGAGDDTADLAELMSIIGADQCTVTDGPQDYEDIAYVGDWEIRTDCAGTGASLVGVVAGPEDGSFTIWVGVQLVTDADFDALDQILNSFVVFR